MTALEPGTRVRVTNAFSGAKHLNGREGVVERNLGPAALSVEPDLLPNPITDEALYVRLDGEDGGGLLGRGWALVSSEVTPIAAAIPTEATA